MRHLRFLKSKKRFVVRLTCLLWEFNTLLISVIWLVVPFHVRDNVPQESGGYVGESLHRLFSTFGDVNSAHFSRDFVYTIFVNSSYW